MIFTIPGNLAGEGGRDRERRPWPATTRERKPWPATTRERRPWPATTRERRPWPDMRGVLSGDQVRDQAIPPVMTLAPPNGRETIPPDPGSYEQVWGVLRKTCESMIGEDACSRLLGHTPFACPVEKPKSSFLIPLLIGAAIGKIIL